MAKIAAKDREGPDEGPVVGMQLGRGHVELCEQLPFEVTKRESLIDTLEYRLVKEKERLPVIGAVINADRFASCAGANRVICIVYPPKGFS